jgi:hypothetical protein
LFSRLPIHRSMKCRIGNALAPPGYALVQVTILHMTETLFQGFATQALDLLSARPLKCRYVKLIWHLSWPSLLLSLFRVLKHRNTSMPCPRNPQSFDSRNSDMTAAWKPLSRFRISGSPDARILLADVPSHSRPRCAEVMSISATYPKWMDDSDVFRGFLPGDS